MKPHKLKKLFIYQITIQFILKLIIIYQKYDKIKKNILIELDI